MANFKRLGYVEGSKLPLEVNWFERELNSEHRRMLGANCKEESNRARIARYNFMGPLLLVHVKYRKWVVKFLNKSNLQNNAKFWISTEERRSIPEWEKFRDKLAEEQKSMALRKAKKNAPVEIHAKVVEPNWKLKMSSSFINPWV